MIRHAVLPLLLLAALPACEPAPRTAQQTADQQTIAACRTRANEVYEQQNRASRYADNDPGTPYSSTYVGGITSRGLSAQYDNQNVVRNCVNNAGADTGRAPAATAEPPSAVINAVLPTRP